MHIRCQIALQKEPSQYHYDIKTLFAASAAQTVDSKFGFTKYYLGKGNNEGLVRRIMSNRATWV